MDTSKTNTKNVASGISKRIVSMVLAMILVVTIFTQVAFADSPDEFQNIPDVGTETTGKKDGNDKTSDNPNKTENKEEEGETLPGKPEEVASPAGAPVEGESAKPAGAPGTRGILAPGGTTDLSTNPGPHTISTDGTYTFTGSQTGTSTLTDHIIKVNSGANVKLEFIDNTTIMTADHKNSPIAIEGSNTKVEIVVAAGKTLSLKSSNGLFTKGGKNPALQVSISTTLLYSGPGALTATTGESYGNSASHQAIYHGAAAIGPKDTSTDPGGNIIIRGGTVNAYAGHHGAGIGGSWSSNYKGTILIYGRNTVVNSYGGGHGAGIGGGCSGGSGTIVVAEGATVDAKQWNIEATDFAAKGDLGAMTNYFYLSDKSANVGSKWTPIGEYTIITDPLEPQGNVELNLDLSNVPVAIQNAFALAPDSFDLSKIYFDTTDSTGKTMKYGYIVLAGGGTIDVLLDDSATTAKGYKYVPAKITPITLGATSTTLYAPNHLFDALTGGAGFTMEYGTTLPSSDFKIKNTKNAIATDRYGEIPMLDFKLTGTGSEFFKVEGVKVDGTTTPVGDYSLPKDGFVDFKITPIQQIPVGTYSLKVTAYSKFTEKQEVAGSGTNGIGEKELDFTFTVTKSTNQGLINITANPLTGQINKEKNDTGIAITVTPVNPADVVTEKKYTITGPGGNIIVGPLDLPADGKVRFPDGTPDGNYTISVTGKSGDNIEDTKTFTYDVDLSRPAVTTITHIPGTGQVSGFIDDKPTDIEITFSESISAVDLANILETLGGKLTIIGTPTISGGNKVNVTIQANKALLGNGDQLDLKVPENVVKDGHENLNTAGDGNVAGNTHLIFSSNAPTVSIPGIVENSIIKTPITEAIVEIKSNAKDGSADLYTTGAGTTKYTDANIGTVVEVIGVNGTPDPTYTLSLVSGNPNNVKIDFGASGLPSGDYEIVVDGKNIYNIEGEKAADITRKFGTRYPEIDSAGNAVTIDRESFDANGGTATITVKGKDLEYADSFVVTSSNGKLTPVTVVGKQTGIGSGEVKIQVTFPPNADYNIHDLYDLTLTMTTAGATPGTVTRPVNSPDGSRSANVQVDRKKSTVNFDINGGKGLVPYFEVDKDDNSGKVNFKSHDLKQPNAPTKANHEFLGWYLGSELIRGEIDLVARGGGAYTLVAKYQDMSDLDNSGNVEKVDPEEDTAKYVDEVEDIKEIEKEIGGEVTITPDPNDPSTAIEYEIEFVWDNTNVKEPGVKTAVVYVVNPVTGEKTAQKQNVYVYITTRPYMSVADLIHVHQYDPITVGGIEWSPVVVEEVPDTVNKVVVLKNHPYRFHRLKFTSSDGMTHQTVAFDAIITTYKGVSNFQVPMKYAYAYIIPRPVTGPDSYKYTAFPYVPSDGSDSFGPTYNPANEPGSKGNAAAAGGAGYSTTNEAFWNATIETLKNMQAGQSWTINSAGGATKNDSVPAGYDSYAKIEVSALNPVMNAAVLKELANMKNARFDVSYGNINYSFDSKDFAGKANNQKGYINFGYTEGNNNVDVNKLLAGRANQQLIFNASDRPVTLGIKLSKDLAGKTNLNMFYFNAATGQLEIIGKMTVSNGVASIKLNGTKSGTYAIVDGLSKSTGTSTGSNSTTAPKTNNEKVLSYRVTDMTRLDDPKTKQAIEADLKDSGKTIESISTFTGSKETIERLDNQEFKPETTNNVNALVAVASAVAIVGVGTAGVYLYFSKKKGINIFKSLFNK